MTVIIFDDLKDLFYKKMGYERIALYSELSDEKKKIFNAEIIDAMKNGTTDALEKKLGMRHYWRKHHEE